MRKLGSKCIIRYEDSLKMHIKTAKHRIFLLCALCSSASLDLETTATTTKDAWISLIVLICSSPSQLLLNHEWTCASVRLFRSHALNAPPQTSPTTFYLPLAWAHIARARAACLTCTMRKRIFTQENKHAHEVAVLLSAADKLCPSLLFAISLPVYMTAHSVCRRVYGT